MRCYTKNQEKVEKKAEVLLQQRGQLQKALLQVKAEEKALLQNSNEVKNELRNLRRRRRGTVTPQFIFFFFYLKKVYDVL
jgi:uncharacterized protein (DUF3084 family)